MSRTQVKPIPLEPTPSLSSDSAPQSPIKSEQLPETSFTNGKPRLMTNLPDPMVPSKGFHIGGEQWIKTWQRLEFGIICVVILVVWGLLSLPIIFYHLPPDSGGSTSLVEQNETSPNVSNCLVYNGSFCLQPIQSCFADNDSAVYISPPKAQGEVEMDLRLLLGLFNAKTELCSIGALRFFCQYLLRPCDSNGTVYLPSSADCNVLQSLTCATEWEATNVALAALNREQLPECEMLPMISSSSCEATTGSDSTNSSSNSTMSATTGVNCTLQCRDGYYCVTVGGLNLCRPQCDEFEEYPYSTVIGFDVAVILSGIVNVIAGTLVLVISCIRWKRMFTFPSVFVVYMTITMFVIAIFILVGFTARSELYCSSLDLVESLDEPTTFCTIAGAVFSYCLLQLALWWFFHLATLFWKIQFPLHAKSFETEGRMKYLHIVTFIVGIVLPVVPVVIMFGTGGFSLSKFPPILCLAAEADVIFYSLILPLIILVQCGISLLVLIFWIIHKQHGLLKAKLSKHPFKIGTAERKLLIVFCYYIVLTVTALTAFTLGTRDKSLLLEELEALFVCESTAPPEPCDISGFQHLTHAEITALSYVLLGLFPSVVLIFAVNIKDVKQWCGRASRYPVSASTAGATNISTVN